MKKPRFTETQIDAWEAQNTAAQASSCSEAFGAARRRCLYAFEY